MPPRISGNLYNCALNCALPTIFENISQLARGTEIPHRQAYESFKLKFEQWYGLEPLSWPAFNAFLKRFSFNDLELIFAHPMRLFVAERGVRQEQVNLREIVEHELQGISPEILAVLTPEELPRHTPGRYQQLAAAQANSLFYHHFGLEMQVFEYNRDTRNYVETTRSAAGRQTIGVFLKEGHYELQPTEACPDYAYGDHIIEEIRDSFMTNASADVTNRALARLVVYVQRSFVESLSVRPSPAPTENPVELITPAQYIENVARFNIHNDTTEGKLTYAIVLLTLMQEFKETQAFASDKLSQHYELTDSAGINKLLTEALAHAPLGQTLKVVADSLDDFTTEVDERCVSVPKKVLSSMEFSAILNSYQTSYWALNCLLQFFSFGFHRHESYTIKALKKLALEHKEITNELVKQALSNTSDGQQQRRFSFWQTADCSTKDNSGTDAVLVELKQRLQ